MDDRIVTLDSFAYPIDANILAGRLEADGIPCFVTGEFMHAVKPLPLSTGGGVHVQVFERDLARARQLTNRNSSSEHSLHGSDTASISCPKCHSSNISSATAVNNVASWLFLIVSTLLFSRPMRTSSYHCYDCGNRFTSAKVSA